MFSKDFKEFIQLLNEHQVKYLIVGGYAVGVHGYPRYTGDIDVWIERSTDTSKKILKVLKDFGLDISEIRETDFLKEDNMFRIGSPPYRIDIITKIDGVNFENCYINKITLDIDGVNVDFIGFDDLIKNKIASGR